MQVFELFLGHILLTHGRPHCKGHKSKPEKSRTRSIFSAMSKLCRAEKHQHPDSRAASQRGPWRLPPQLLHMRQHPRYPAAAAGREAPMFCVSCESLLLSERGRNSRQSGGTQPSTRRRDPPPVQSPMSKCSPHREPTGLCPQAATASFNSRRSSPETHR